MEKDTRQPADGAVAGRKGGRGPRRPGAEQETAAPVREAEPRGAPQVGMSRRVPALGPEPAHLRRGAARSEGQAEGFQETC